MDVIKNVNIDDISGGSIKHPVLPDEMIERIKAFKMILLEVEQILVEQVLYSEDGIYSTSSSPSRKLRFLVPEVGLEPTLLTEHDFESCASTIPPLRQVIFASLQT